MYIYIYIYIYISILKPFDNVFHKKWFNTFIKAKYF